MSTEKAFADAMNNTKVMIAGLKKNVEQMSKRGIDTDFIEKIENLYVANQGKDNEQEDLKAKLKTATAQLNSGMKEMDELYSEAKKMVKVEMDQETWKTFGISDSK